MKTSTLVAAFGLLVLGSVPVHGAAKQASDLSSPDKRRATVDIAQRLTRPPVPAPVPADLIQPFNPPGFDQPDPEEVRAAAAAAAAAAARSSPALAGGPGGPPGSDAPPAQPADRELLQNLSANLPSSGFMTDRSGAPLLVLGTNKLGINDIFTVKNTTDGQEYELTLVAIQRTTFTLRFHGEEISRPIGKRKSP